jgi:hypothetical protein
MPYSSHPAAGHVTPLLFGPKILWDTGVHVGTIGNPLPHRRVRAGPDCAKVPGQEGGWEGIIGFPAGSREEGCAIEMPTILWADGGEALSILWAAGGAIKE